MNHKEKVTMGIIVVAMAFISVTTIIAVEPASAQVSQDQAATISQFNGIEESAQNDVSNEGIRAAIALNVQTAIQSNIAVITQNNVAVEAPSIDLGDD